jgi:Kelch motif
MLALLRNGRSIKRDRNAPRGITQENELTGIAPMYAVARLRPLALLTWGLATTAGMFGPVANGQQSPSGSHWVTVAPMSQVRVSHSMVELPVGPNALGLSTGPGKVMVIGGFDSEALDIGYVPANPLASCEVYDPSTNTWTPAAPHPVAGGFRWATVLSNGMVLVAGGWANATTLAFNRSSHLYDPRTNTWIATQPLPIGLANPHAFMRAVSLPNGQVLIAGGLDDKCCNKNKVTHFSANSYVFTLNPNNPAASSWDYTRRGSTGKVSMMPDERTTSALVLMNNGVVLNVGGFGPIYQSNEVPTNTADLYDPRTGTWVRATPMPPVFGIGEDEQIQELPTSQLYPYALGSRWAPYAESLGDGGVLVAGGRAGHECSACPLLWGVLRSSALIYNPGQDTWTITNPMHARRPFGFWSGRLSTTGDILFSGPGYSPDGSLLDVAGEIFHPATQQWTLAPTSNGPPSDHSITSFESKMIQLSNGNLQIAGGADEQTESLGTSGSWIFVP